MLFEKGCQAQAFTLSTWPRNVCRHLSDDRSHNLVVWSIAQEARKSPVWWKAQSQTACVWSEKVWAQAAPAKVPDLHGSVSRSRRQAAAGRVKVNAADPVPVTLAGHHQVAVRHAPELPGGIIRNSGLRMRPCDTATPAPFATTALTWPLNARVEAVCAASTA